MPRPLLVTADLSVLEAVLAVSGGGDVELDVTDTGRGALAGWERASVVVVGADLVGEVGIACAGRQLLPRRSVLVVTVDLDDTTVWRRAQRACAAWVVLLPAGGEWLLRELSACSGPAGAGARWPAEADGADY